MWMSAAVFCGSLFKQLNESYIPFLFWTLTEILDYAGRRRGFHVWEPRCRESILTISSINCGRRLYASCRSSETSGLVSCTLLLFAKYDGVTR